MAAARPATEASVLASLDSLIDLEFYMPVPNHWESWDGGPNLIVAGTLRDHEIPIAFDLGGRPVVIASAEEPPATPALVVVRVETDFSKPPLPAAPRAPATHVPGLYMTSAWVPDDHEGWSAGQPEFEVHVFREDPSTSWLVDISCAGERQTGDFYYDQNGTHWTGEVLLATESQLGTTPTVEVQMWEDDMDPCTTTGGRPPKPEHDVTIEKLRKFAAGVVQLYTATQTGDPVKIVGAIIAQIPLSLDIVTSLNPDDTVGILSGPVGGCFESSGPVRYNIQMAS